LGNVNLNPLSVKKSKVVLVHDAEVESVDPVLRTKIAWVSSVVNVAGTSQYLDPDGADVFGINNLFGEFLNVGTFDTPYVDEDVRVSRSPGPIVEQIRVFVRDGSSVLDDEVMMESLTAELRVEEEREAAEEEKKDVGVQARKVAEATASMAENARSTIEKDMEGVNKALSETMDDVVGKVQDAVEEDLEQIGKAVQGVQSAIRERGDVGEALSNATEAVAKVPEDVRSIVEEDASNLADEVEGALETMVADVQDSVETDLEEIGKSIEGMRDAVSGDDEEEDETKEE
jgi:DNA anti-recombination protein RmuC